MRTNPEYILRTIVDDHILVPCGEATTKFNGLINLNETAAFVWNAIDDSKDVDEIIQKVMKEFEVDEEMAAKDVKGLIKELIMVGMVIE